MGKQSNYNKELYARIYVPLFNNDGKSMGTTTDIFEQFGVYSFEMDNNLDEFSSLLYDLFRRLCYQAGLMRRVICAETLELGKTQNGLDFKISNSATIGRGDFFTIESIFHLLRTAYIPYWRYVADKINAYQGDDGFCKGYKRAVKALDNWKEFNKKDVEEMKWIRQWANAKTKRERQKLIKGDNWRLSVKDADKEIMKLIKIQ